MVGAASDRALWRDPPSPPDPPSRSHRRVRRRQQTAGPLILLVVAACISSCTQILRAQPARPAAPKDEFAAIFGALAFDSLGRGQGGIPTEIRWFAADTLTYRLLQPYAIDRGLHLDIWRSARPSCSWNTSPATREAASPVGLLFELSTRVDSTGQLLASARMSCRGPTEGAGRPARGNFATGIVVQLVKEAGKWRIAKVVDRWIT